jgi:hypothetical protein
MFPVEEKSSIDFLWKTGLASADVDNKVSFWTTNLKSAIVAEASRLSKR